MSEATKPNVASASRAPTPDFSTCDLCDEHRGDGTGRVRVLPAVLRDFGAHTRFAGPVQTVRCFDDNSAVKAAVERSGLIDTPHGLVGQVLLVDGAGSMRTALLGGKLGVAAAANGWAGVVIDGCVRDVAELSLCAVGIRAHAAMPLPTDRQGQGQTGLPIIFMGVPVRPGDWLYADQDGIVIADRPLV